MGNRYNLPMFREMVVRIGLVKGVLLATVLATSSSVLFTWMIMAWKGMGLNEIALTISILAPATIAPFLFWPLFSAFITIDHMEREMRRLAMVDELTNIMNRRAFLNNAEYAVSLANRNRMELALVYLDLDNFKAINDVHGHAAGDIALREFASTVSNMVRKSDLFGRLGGEEFALVMTGADKAAARRFVEKLLAEIRGNVIAIPGNAIHITASAGLSFLGIGENKTLAQLLGQANMALHQAKHVGKNCLVEHGES